MAPLMLPRVTVEAALSSNPLDAAPIYTDVTNGATPAAGLLTCKTQRGRQHELTQMQAGTCVLRYRNTNDWWNPWNTLSPLYNPTTGYPGLLPNPSFENSLADWGVETNCTLGNFAAPKDTGDWSMRLLASSAADCSAITQAYLPVSPSTQYTLSAMFTPNSTQRNVVVAMIWYTSGLVAISTDASAATAEGASGFTRAVKTATSPGTAAFVRIRVQIQAPANGEAHYVDTVILKAGADTYVATVTGLQPMKKVRVSAEWPWLATNLLPNPQFSGTTTWGVEANCTFSLFAAPTYDGTSSAGMVASAGGDMSIISPSALPYTTVKPSFQYTAVAHFTPNTATRQVRVTVIWYNNLNAAITTSVGTAVTEAASGWTRVSVTDLSPATAVSARVRVQVLGAGVGEQHFVNTVLLAEGADGGLQRVVTGYVQEIKQVWPDSANAEVEITVVDGFKVLNLSQIISTAYHDAVLADTPAGYYSLNETTNSTPDGSGVILAVDASGNLYNGSYRGAPSYGASGALPAETGTGVDLGVRAAYVDLSLGPTPSGTGNFTIEAWVNPRTWPAAAYDDKIYSKRAFSGHNIQISINTDGKLRFWVSDGTNGGTLDTTTALTLRHWNHVAAVKTGTTGPANWKIYINGAEVSTGAVLLGTGNANIAADTSMIGGRVLAGNPAPAFDGVIDEFATYFSALTSTRVTAHYNAAYGLTANSLAGARIGNLLDLIGWPAADRSLAAGQFQLQGVTQSLYTTTSLSYILQAVESEGYPAAFFMNGAGVATFQDRANATPTSSGTFGDNAGELHYNLDAQSVPVRDDLDIWTTVVCQATGGAAQTVFDATTQGRYVKRTLSKTGLLNASDTDVLTLANALLARNKDPHDRVKTVRLQPNTDPGNLFAAVLGAEINNRYTVNRHRSLGSGTQLSLDTRCEGIAHDIDFTTGNWFTTLMLIPT